MKPHPWGIFASVVADATAYSVYPPVCRVFVAPNTASPALNCGTPVPRASTTPATSDPSVNGSGWGRTLRPDLIQASHGPTPSAFTRSNTSPLPGVGRGTSSATRASRPPKWCTRIASIKHLTQHHIKRVKRDLLDDGVVDTSGSAGFSGRLARLLHKLSFHAQINPRDIRSKEECDGPVENNAQPPVPARHLKEVVSPPQPPGEKAREPHTEDSRNGARMPERGHRAERAKDER
jgi:hypothetical protein